MATFNEALRKGAQALEISDEVLREALRSADITEETWVHCREQDFLEGVQGRLKTKSVERSAIRVRAAFAAMNQTLQGAPVGLPQGLTAEAATVEQLLQIVDVRVPESEVMEALLNKRVPGQGETTFREIAFFVLKGEDKHMELDRPATRAVVDLLRKGMPVGADEIVDPDTRKTYVVYRYDELPTAQAHMIDPLFPEQDLKLGKLSTRFNVIVPRDGWSEEKHRLLLFLRQKGKVRAPQDKPAYEETVQHFANDRVEELLDRYGGKGVYEKAKRLPLGSPAGLPSISRGGSSAGTSGAARAWSGSEGAGQDLRLSSLPREKARDLLLLGRVEDHRRLLSEIGLTPKGNKDDLVKQILAADPPLRLVHDHVVMDGEQIVDGILEVVSGVPAQEISWRVFLDAARNNPGSAY